MACCIALLRGVNVGGAKKVPMAAWRALLEEMGLTRVRTLLNSGNAVFEAPPPVRVAALATRIAARMAERFGFEVPVIVLTARTLKSIVQDCPLDPPPAPEAFSRTLVAFVQLREKLVGLTSITSQVLPDEQFAIGRDAAYLHCARGILESEAAVALLSAAGKNVLTTRNWATVLKVLAACAPD